MEPADQGEIASRLDYAELALKNGDPAAALTVVHGVLGAEGGSWALEEPWRARRLLASALEGVGDYADAIAELETLVARVPRDRHWIVLLIALVRCHRESGHLARANRTGHDALREVEQESLGDTEDGVRLMVTVASVHILARDFDGALRLCELAGERADAIGSTIGRASAWWNSCLAYYGRGDLEAAAPLGEAALAAFEASGDLRAQGMLHMNLASIRSDLEPPDLEAADAHVARAESLLSWSEASLVERSKVRSAAAVIEYLRGDLEGARRSIEQCLEMVGESAPNFAAFCLMLLGRVALAESNRVEALSHVETAVLRLAACGQDQEIAAAWFELGGLLDELGDASGAMDAFRRAAISTGRVSPDLAPARL